MIMEGTVQISIKDFEELRSKAKSFEELRKKINGCTKVEDIETGECDDCWYQMIFIDAEKIAELATIYADVEEVRENDVIKFSNMEEYLL